MDNESDALPSLKIPEAVPLRFGDLAFLIARARLVGDTEIAALARASAAINIEERLTELVAYGVLTVRNPLGMTRLHRPTGRLLQDSVLIPSVDLEPLSEEFGIRIRFVPFGTGPTHWTIDNGAAAIAEQQGWHFGARDTLGGQMLDAAKAEHLVVFHPHTDLPMLPAASAEVHAFCGLVTRDGVNAWLSGIRAPYRWEDTAQALAAAEPAPVSGDEWKELARDAARVIVKRAAASDRYPPQADIADEIAADFRKRGIVGAHGKPLSGATIKRHALRGISSAKKKAQSTTVKRGK